MTVVRWLTTTGPYRSKVSMNEIVEKPEYDTRSAMFGLSPQRQAFVEAMVAGGATPQFVERAAAQAGYATKYGWALMREPRILAALREEAAKGLLGGALIGQKVLIEIATNSEHKDRFRAAKELLAHSGFTITQTVELKIDQTNSEARELIKEIKEFAKATGLDAKQLLGSIGVRDVIVDAEFVEVKESPIEPIASAAPAEPEVWGV